MCKCERRRSSRRFLGFSGDSRLYPRFEFWGFERKQRDLRNSDWNLSLYRNQNSKANIRSRQSDLGSGSILWTTSATQSKLWADQTYPALQQDRDIPFAFGTGITRDTIMASTINYTYEYPFESAVLESAATPAMRLATSLDGTSDDLFFDGRIRRPALVGKCLAVLAAIIRKRFYMPFNPLLVDPVVTSGGGYLRFEGFSSCCGVYVRMDLDPDAFDTELRGKGTTNVDFNDSMRMALRCLTDQDDVQMQVGGEGVTLRTENDKVVERKVKLPVRWVKSFCEVQAYQPRLTPHFELNAIETRDLFRSFPKSTNAKRPVYITRSGKTVRLASRKQNGSVQLFGVERVAALDSLVPHLTKLNIWYDVDAETSGWEFHFDVGRMFALMSPEMSRGFSGEGQVLSRLATGKWQNAVPHVADSLKWQSQIDSAAISQKHKCPESDVEAALAVLGTRGLVGFDVNMGKYFHRVLPFDFEKVEKQQPSAQGRQKACRKRGAPPA